MDLDFFSIVKSTTRFVFSAWTDSLKFCWKFLFKIVDPIKIF